jgi:hypothetical protein
MYKALRICFLSIIIMTLSSCGKQQPTLEGEITDGKQRGDQIVRAIEKYYIDFEVYPENLSNLIPKYLTKLPQTTAEVDYTYKQIEGDIYYVSFPVTSKEIKTTCTFIKKLEDWECSVFLE